MNDFTPRLQSTALPTHRKVRLKDGRWVRGSSFGSLLILGNADELARKGFVPREGA